jgi:hypothetical protein
MLPIIEDDTKIVTSIYPPYHELEHVLSPILPKFEFLMLEQDEF